MALVEVPEPAPIEILTRELLTIDKHIGYVDPETVVDLAKSPTHPLHPFFEWDNTEAAHAFRLIQAMGLIRKVRVKVTTIENGKQHSVRGFLPASIVGRDLPPYSYITQDEIVKDPIAKEAVLRQMQRDISSLERRYSDMAEFWDSVTTLASNRPTRKSK